MSISSIVSHKNRGHWGDSKWRGNCSGYVYKDLFDQYGPKSFCDPMVGSGTSVEVAKEMGIEAYGLDLHSGFNVLKQSIANTIGKQVDMCFSHPAYGELLHYSGEVWGSEPHPDDMSRCGNGEEFMEKLQIALLNQRDATKSSGFYGLLLGDLRRDNKYYCFSADILSRMPKNELASVIIKAQHNCVSDNRDYGRLKHPRIVHEYIMLWQKPRIIMTSVLEDLSLMAKQAAATMTSIWKATIKNALIALGGQSELATLYERIQSGASERLMKNKNWQAKVRQILQTFSDFQNVERGVWKLA